MNLELKTLRSGPKESYSEREMAAEQALVARAHGGDEAAFRALVDRYRDLVAATVVGMLGPGAEAEDVGQETFVRFYRSLPRYRGEGGVAPYITKIAVNLSLNALEKRKRRRGRFRSRDARPDLPEPAVDGERTAGAFDRQRLVRRALGALSPEHRAVVVLRLIDGYSTKETAALLDLPVGTVLSRLYRAQQNMKTYLAPYLRDHES